jgi:hypothetical protein
MPGVAVLDCPPREREVVRVCCHCQRIRDSSGEWQLPAEDTRERVTHTICRTCFLTFYPEVPPPPEFA